MCISAVVAAPKPTKDLPPFEAWNTGAKIAKRTDIKTILILGPGPIIIGQVKLLVILMGPPCQKNGRSAKSRASCRLVNSTTVGRKHARP